jgi:hypothetical protein
MKNLNHSIRNNYAAEVSRCSVGVTEMICRVIQEKAMDVSDRHTVSNFRVEKEAQPEARENRYSSAPSLDLS